MDSPNPTVECVGVSKDFRKFTALQEISLSLSPGVTALIGPNGAGKTTLMRILAGGLVPTRGQVLINGNNIYASRERPAALSDIAWMPQLSEIPQQMRAIDLVSYLTWMRGCDSSEAQARAEQALHAVGLTKSTAAKMSTLSGGMIRRVWLAQALAAQAPVLLLDEPSTGLDPRQRETMVRLIRETVNGTVLLSSHLLEDVRQLADRVVVLDRGRIIFDGPLEPSMDAAWFMHLTGEESE